MKQRLIEQYAPLIEQFLNGISGLDVTEIPAPHIPIMGQSYEAAKYKIAFIGMETYGWTDINEFCRIAKEDLKKAVTYDECTINSLEYLGCASNYTSTFWGFVLKFLAKFYNILDFNSFIGDKQTPIYKDILTSFIWGETNSIERYHVSAGPNNVDPEIWEAAKRSSICFDSVSNLIKSVAPKLIFILNRKVDDDYILNDDAVRACGVPVENKKATMSLDVDDGMKIRYYYLRDDNVHIIALPHPRWMGVYSGYSIDRYVDRIINLIQDFQIWDELPTKATDWKGEVIEYRKSSIEYKRAFIAELASTLMKNRLVMSGKELQLLLNMNHILTQYGTDYAESGGRGVHKLISSVWKYYYDKKDYQTAYNIARAFVNQNGEYAYEI